MSKFWAVSMSANGEISNFLQCHLANLKRTSNEVHTTLWRLPFGVRTSIGVCTSIGVLTSFGVHLYLDRGTLEYGLKFQPNLHVLIFNYFLTLTCNHSKTLAKEKKICCQPKQMVSTCRQFLVFLQMGCKQDWCVLPFHNFDFAWLLGNPQCTWESSNWF